MIIYRYDVVVNNRTEHALQRTLVVMGVPVRRTYLSHSCAWVSAWDAHWSANYLHLDRLRSHKAVLENGYEVVD